jgi:hypothetical protein
MHHCDPDLRVAGTSRGGRMAFVVFGEVLILVANGWRGPLTTLATRFSEEGHDNFDIYLPLWLARHNKLIFGALYVAGMAFAYVRWVKS